MGFFFFKFFQGGPTLSKLLKVGPPWKNFLDPRLHGLKTLEKKDTFQ